MSYGITPNGFVRKTLQVIKAELEASYRAAFGDIRTDSESGFGQLIGIQADELSLLWEAAEDVYLSQYPATAESSSLDNVLNLNGLSRLGSSSSFIDLVLERTDESADVTIVIDPEFQVLSNDNDLFKLVAKTILYDLREAENVGVSFDIHGVYIEAASISGTYEMTLNGFDIVYVSQVGDTLDDILAGLLLDIQNTEIAGVSAELIERVPAEIGGETGTKTLYVKTTGDFFNFGQYSGPSTLTLYQSAKFESIETAVTNVIQSEPFGTVQTPRAGITSVVGAYSDGQIGRSLEADADARLRRYESLQIVGGATVDAVRSNLLQKVDGVFAATVIENDTLTPIPINLPVPFDEFPPKSLWCIVDGGADADIAQGIFDTKSAGIEAFGDLGPFDVFDDQQILHSVRFSRSSNISIYVDIEITLSNEEDSPTNIVDLVQENVVNYLNSLAISEDVIYQKLFTPIYAVGGIAEVVLKISKVFPAVGTVNIPIDFNEKARTDNAKVTVAIS